MDFVGAKEVWPLEAFTPVVVLVPAVDALASEIFFFSSVRGIVGVEEDGSSEAFFFFLEFLLFLLTDSVALEEGSALDISILVVAAGRIVVAGR